MQTRERCNLQEGTVAVQQQVHPLSWEQLASVEVPLGVLLAPSRTRFSQVLGQLGAHLEVGLPVGQEGL